MQIHRPLQHQIEKLTAAARALRLWVVELFAWWVMTFGDRDARIALQRYVTEARRQTRDLVFMAMVARMTFRKCKRRWMRPPSARAGFRYAIRALRVQKIYTRGLKLKTLKDIRAVLENFERIVERAIARVPKHTSTGRLVILRSVGAPAHGGSSTADADEGVGAPDTS
ncbi:MAG: hypothetical protein IV086_00085 [Hyphomonadaceae bacterium]|nr:MAG: hypothetical protein FD160_2117 [Caulobacteraceae bacterium]MBT9444075.1 hypothetical protein [Hyphomonadaceae bacterium]TPW03890.1 MAG: hypothetical protein FD124_2840 [Alphaproteobacteria bacterium]